MKLKDLYSLKGIPVVTYTITTVCFIISCLVCYVIPEHFADICLQTKPENIWQYFSGVFIHNIEPKWVMWVHMGLNCMMSFFLHFSGVVVGVLFVALMRKGIHKRVLV